MHRCAPCVPASSDGMCQLSALIHFKTHIMSQSFEIWPFKYGLNFACALAHVVHVPKFMLALLELRLVGSRSGHWGNRVVHQLLSSYITAEYADLRNLYRKLSPTKVPSTNGGWTPLRNVSVNAVVGRNIHLPGGATSASAVPNMYRGPIYSSLKLSATVRLNSTPQIGVALDPNCNPITKFDITVPKAGRELSSV